MTTSSAARRVLVADDDPSILRILVLNLEADDLEVTTADNGTDAQRLATELLPDLIVLDVMMPGLDGFAVLAALREQPETRDIPVVLLTARATDAEVWEGWQSGADYYMTKPFDVGMLLRLVDDVLNNGPYQR